MKNTVNHSYFEKIDTPNKAYILGFLYADGCVTIQAGRKFRMSLQIQERDLELIKSIKNELDFSGKIGLYKSKEKNQQNKVSIQIYSRRMCQDLIKLGCVPAKSLILTFPTEDQVPKELIRHFIRGYFDGDGSVYSQVTGRHKTPQFAGGIVGTFDVCESINTILHDEIGINKKKINAPVNRKVCRYCFCGNAQTKLIFNYLYTDADLFLSRKKEKMQLVFNT